MRVSYLSSVPVTIRFTKAEATGVVLAKVGNPLRDEPLETSREVCRIGRTDCELLTRLLLKPFKRLTGYRFHHHSSVKKNEIYNCAKAVFQSEEALLEKGCDIARRLYAKNRWPIIDVTRRSIEEVAAEIMQQLAHRFGGEVIVSTRIGGGDDVAG